MLLPVIPSSRHPVGFQQPKAGHAGTQPLMVLRHPARSTDDKIKRRIPAFAGTTDHFFEISNRLLSLG
jgi:hypothetical protein